MAFVTGLLLIDAPASALNNAGKVPSPETGNVIAAKHIPTPEGNYPYVSAQAFRYWLRTTLQKGSWGWKAAPVFREQKIAYSDANPIRYWDDDLFGYMRAPSKTSSRHVPDPADEDSACTPTTQVVTRASPFRVSTLVSIAPAPLVTDFGTMTRHEGDQVPHEHQFYRTTLQSLFSLDLHAAGTFTYIKRAGYLNLDEARIEEARDRELQELPVEKAFRLPTEQRLQRIAALLEALPHLSGGAKSALHYTDVSPVVLFAAVTRGGNHIFRYAIGADPRGHPFVKIEALNETIEAWSDDILSHIYIGWEPGYLDAERARLAGVLRDEVELPAPTRGIRLGNTREILAALVDELRGNTQWLD